MSLLKHEMKSKARSLFFALFCAAVGDACFFFLREMSSSAKSGGAIKNKKEGALAS